MRCSKADAKPQNGGRALRIQRLRRQRRRRARLRADVPAARGHDAARARGADAAARPSRPARAAAAAGPVSVRCVQLAHHASCFTRVRFSRFRFGSKNGGIQRADGVERRADTTLKHNLALETLTDLTAPLLGPPGAPGAGAAAPLAAWTTAFLRPTFAKLRRLYGGPAGAAVPLSLHDPLVVWSLLAPRGGVGPAGRARDVRVETGGQWTRGACVVDRRGLGPDPVAPRSPAAGAAAPGDPAPEGEGGSPLEVERRAGDVAGGRAAAAAGDSGAEEAGWLDGGGNRVFVVEDVTGWEEGFGGEMLRRIYGV